MWELLSVLTAYVNANYSLDSKLLLAYWATLSNIPVSSGALWISGSVYGRFN